MRAIWQHLSWQCCCSAASSHRAPRAATSTVDYTTDCQQGGLCGTWVALVLPAGPETLPAGKRRRAGGMGHAEVGGGGWGDGEQVPQKAISCHAKQTAVHHVNAQTLCSRNSEVRSWR